MKKDVNVLLIKILKWITLFVLVYVTIWIILNMLNYSPFYKVLECMNMYRIYYDFINIFNPTIFYLIIAVLILAIPYLIISIYLGISILIKYIKRKKNITKTILLTLVLVCTLLSALRTLPLTSEYIIKVNSKADQIENIEVSKFVKENIRGNPYITYIEVKQGFPDDYNIKIHYIDSWFKTEDTFLSDSNYDFVNNNAKNITNIKTIISIVLLIINIILYIYFCKYIIKEYNKLTDIDVDKNNSNFKDNSIKRYILLSAITIFSIIIIITTYIVIKSNNKINSNPNNNLTEEVVQEESDKGGDILMTWMFENNVGISIRYQGSWSGRDILSFEKTTDGGETYIIQNPSGFNAHYGWKALFIDSNIGFINDPGIPENGENYGFYITTDSGKTFKKANLIHPDEIEEKNLLVDGVPYYENEILKLKIYTLNYMKNPISTYYEFYSEDNGLNWKIYK